MQTQPVDLHSNSTYITALSHSECCLPLRPIHTERIYARLRPSTRVYTDVDGVDALGVNGPLGYFSEARPRNFVVQR